MATRRIVVTLTTDMADALKQQARARGANQSELIRLILREWLQTAGVTGDLGAVEWGRPDLGQRMAAKRKG